MVGVGAIGCELLHGLARSSVHASITVVDPDLIALSNLSRQLLFRDHHVGSSKASTAAMVAMQLSNHRLHITPVCALLTADHPHSHLFQQASLVLGAVDNIAARTLCDEQAKAMGIPYIDCGTLGGQCSLQVVVPHLFESYGSSSDPDDGSNTPIPQCTLHMFPSKPLHCVLAAVDAFARPGASERILQLRELCTLH